MRRNLASFAFAIVSLVAPTASAQQRAPACTNPVTFCEGHSGYYVAPDDKDKVQGQLEPLLKDLRACLDAAGGKHVSPVIIIRFDSDAKPVETKVEAGGYESLPCVADVTAKLANARSVRATSMRCEYGCPKPKTSPPVTPTPVPVPVPTPTPGATQTQTQAQPQPGTTPPPGTAAPARPPPPPVSKGTHTEKTWYGWQNLVSDSVSVVLVGAGIAAKSGGLAVAGTVGYVLGSPTVHWVHGNVGKGFGSMGMRLGLPLAGAGIGAIAGAVSAADRRTTSTEDAGDSIGTGALIGMFIGGAIPVIIDAAAWGWEKEEVPNAAKVTVTPMLSVQRGGGFAGVGGSF